MEKVVSGVTQLVNRSRVDTGALNAKRMDGIFGFLLEGAQLPYLLHRDFHAFAPCA